MMNTQKRAMNTVALAASMLGVMMLSGSASRAQTGSHYNCVNTPGGALCYSSTAANADGEQYSSDAASAFAAAPGPGDFTSRPGSVFLPGAVAHEGEVIGRDPDANVRLNLMRDPHPEDRD